MYIAQDPNRYRTTATKCVSQSRQPSRQITNRGRADVLKQIALPAHVDGCSLTHRCCPWNDAHALRYVDVETMTVMLPLSERDLPTLPAKIANSRSSPGKLPEQHGDSTTTVVPAMVASINYCAAAAVTYLITTERHQQDAVPPVTCVLTDNAMQRPCCHSYLAFPAHLLH
jgi:hypothetical protein